jgi:hypothetical protein
MMEGMTHPDWTKGPRTRMDALRAGTRFLSMDGEVWTYDRRDRALSGFHHCTKDDGEKSGFAGCAEVLVLP